MTPNNNSFYLSKSNTFFLKDVHLIEFMKFINSKGVDIYFVGGAVRNALFGKSYYQDDVDLAVSCTPYEIMELANEKNIKHIPTGIDFGTITIIIANKSYEITSFRKDIETDGRRAKVVFGGSVNDDAKRRDFTFNAIYCDYNGKVFSPINGAIKDALNTNLRFIGDTKERIKEDYLRILRYLRFAAIYGLPTDIENVCKQIFSLFANMKIPSSERNMTELRKMVQGKYFLNIIDLISKYNIDKAFFDIKISNEIFREYIEFTKKFKLNLNNCLMIFTLFGFQYNDSFCYKRSEKRMFSIFTKLKDHLSKTKCKYEIIYLRYEFPFDVFALACFENISIRENINMLEFLLREQLPGISFTQGDIAKEGFKNIEIKYEYKNRVIGYLKENLR